MKIPKSFNEITISQYQQVFKIHHSDLEVEDREAQIISLLSGETIEKVEKLPLSKFKEVVRSLSFLYNSNLLPKELKPFVVSGATIYKPWLKLDELQTAQFVDLKTFQSRGTVIENFHLLLACIYTPVNWLGKQKEYDPKIHAKVAQDMLNVKVGEVSGTLFFYSNVFEKLSPTILMSFQESRNTINSLVKEMMEDKEFLSSVGVGEQ